LNEFTSTVKGIDFNVWFNETSVLCKGELSMIVKRDFVSKGEDHEKTHRGFAVIDFRGKTVFISTGEDIKKVKDADRCLNMAIFDMFSSTMPLSVKNKEAQSKLRGLSFKNLYNIHEEPLTEHKDIIILNHRLVSTFTDLYGKYCKN